MASLFKKLFFILFFLLIVISLAVFVNPKLSDRIGADSPIKIKKQPETTKLVFVGDMMLDRGVKSSVINNLNGSYLSLFDYTKETLSGADILFGNLEGPISDKGNNVGSKYSFRMSPEVFPVLKESGFDVLSFANNHVGDWNVSAFTDTLERASSTEIIITGAGKTKSEASEVDIIEKNGTKFGFLAFSDVGPAWIKAGENSPGILLLADPSLSQIISEAKIEVNVLIVSIHWGDEYKEFNSRQQEYAHKIIDSGADLIIGHHPHVIQGTEKYKDGLIFYSLGNFIFDQKFSEKTMEAGVVEIIYDGKTPIKTTFYTWKLNSFFQPEKIIQEVAI